MSPAVMWCQNRCLHCWRAIEHTLGTKIDKKRADSPKLIIDECIKEQKKLLYGFGGNKKTSKQKLKEALEPKHFAISLSGEPTIYPYLGELIKELRKRKITSFLVTNGLNPEVLLKLQKENALPTQLYLSLNAPNKNLFMEFTNPLIKGAWTRFNKTIKIFPKLKTRKVLRITLVKDLNMDDNLLEDYENLIKIAKSSFIEIKSYMAIGYSRDRLGYNRMPFFNEIMAFSKKIAQLTGYKIEDYSKESVVILLKKDHSVKRFIS